MPQFRDLSHAVWKNSFVLDIIQFWFFKWLKKRDMNMPKALRIEPDLKDDDNITFFCVVVSEVCFFTMYRSESSGWQVSKRLESVRIGKCQNTFFFKIGKCQNRKVSELESVRIGKCQNRKGSELENVRFGKCQNWKVSELESVRILKHPE